SHHNKDVLRYFAPALSNTCHNNGATMVTYMTDNIVSSLQGCCSTLLYEIGQDVGALTETLRSTIRRLDETISRLEASEAQLAALNNTLLVQQHNISHGVCPAHVQTTSDLKLKTSQRVSHQCQSAVKDYTNLGNGYNPVTGFFTAPVKGVYSFSFTSFFWGEASKTSGGSLYHNRKKVVSWHHNVNVNHATSGSNSAVLMLNAGDKVNVYLWAGRTIADNVNKYSSFSGFLLYTL
uniref:C1q domain-containing protein n=1 Tax=Neogobius melanostomus TaxID=47308 RepID=A0A8C6TRA9_9GOBI